jgi:hypothetical protein
LPKTKIIVAGSFTREYRTLCKRYASLKSDLARILPVLEIKPDSGIPLGGGIYKIRLAIKSKQKGKSGGARIITSYLSKNNVLYLLTIYDKSDQETISEQVIDALLQAALVENPVE